MSKVRYASWEVGPTWDMVEQWLKNFKDTTRRSIVISSGYHVFRNGRSALWWEASSWNGGGRRAPEHYYATCWYWPNSRYVSLPAMVIGLITAHEREIDAIKDRWQQPGFVLPEEELPL